MSVLETSGKVASSPAKEKKVLSPLEMSAYGSGHVAYMLGMGSVMALISPIVVIELEMSPLIFGMIVTITRAWDAITDPLCGHISDRLETRWGRRRPMLLIGAVAVGALFPLMTLLLRPMPENTFFALLLVSFLIYYSCFTVYSVPYMSLGFELTPNPKERVRLFAVRTFFTLIPTGINYWLYRIVQMEHWDSTIVGARWVGLGLGIVIIAAGMMPALFTRERYYRVAKKKHDFTFKQSVKYVATNKPFLVIMSITMIIMLGVDASNSIGGYTTIYYLFKGDTVAGATLGGIAGTVTMAVGFSSVFLVSWMANRFGKIKALRFCIGMNMLGNLSQWFLFRPDMPYLALISYGIIACGTLSFWIVANAIKADVCDWDEYRSGVRHEGVVASASNWIQKGSSSLSALIAGAGLTIIGFDVEFGGNQSESTFLWLRICLSLIPAGLLLICLYLTKLYPLTEDGMAKVKMELEERRGTVS